MKLNARSEAALRGVHPKLDAVVRRAAEMLDAPEYDGLEFIVTEGLRNATRQAQLVKVGASRTMNSRHLTGHAVDLAAVVDGDVRWDWPLYGRLAGVMKAAATELGVSLTWGGDWTTLRDGPHYELNPVKYPWPRAA